MVESGISISADAAEKVTAPSATEDGAAAITTAVPRPSLRAWLRDHDEQWLFVVFYLGASVLLSILISLFWLLVVIFVHFIFECIRQAHYRDGRSNVLLHALWEVKIDIGLAALAFAVALYVDVILGILGLQSAGRVAAAARFGARAAAWERNIRTFLLTIDEITRISHAAYVFGMRRRNRSGSSPSSDDVTAAATSVPRDPLPPAWRQRWGWGDRIGLTLVTGGVCLMLLAPLLTPHDVPSAIAVIMEQLRPFP